MKIAYIIRTLATQSGANRIITEKANLLSLRLGYDVTIITYYQQPKQDDIYKANNKVKRVHLFQDDNAYYKYSLPRQIWEKWQLRRRLRKNLTDAVRQIDPDILIGVAQVDADLVTTIKCRAKKVIECHEARSFTMSGFGIERSLFSRIYNSLIRYRYFKTVEKYADAIAPLTEKDKLLWKNTKHLVVIPNFSLMDVTATSDCTQKRVIAVGRLAWEKGYGRLLKAWKIASTRFPDWQLDIFGEGDMKATMNTIIRQNAIKNLAIHNFTTNISQEYSKSSICALTSCYEGFSLALLEALKHGVPCVAFDCPFGPSSIIEDGRCGFLVEDGDCKLFAERLCRLMGDLELRHLFSRAGIERAKTFDIDVIIGQWKTLFENLTEQSR